MSFYGYIELQRCTVITDSALAVMAVTVQCQCSTAVFVHCSRPCSGRLKSAYSCQTPGDFSQIKILTPPPLQKLEI